MSTPDELRAMAKRCEEIAPKRYSAAMSERANDMRAVLALIEIADSNFPGYPSVTLTVNGKNGGHVTLPARRFRALLAAANQQEPKT